ncbi:antitoxin MazE-like protein [uncultured Castellaniella sp.]|uniref:antitoxin MazE-like protein n=1 Tax=uncultured Castellaniella sp. TaxID=647907 RepID=UPI00260B01EB|nr:antitoxin MazE-like protein [uncultured Castellaniella sp.]
MSHVLSHKASQAPRPTSNGMRRLQIWVPDTRDAGYATQVKAQCVALKHDAAEQDALAFAEAAAHDIESWR